MTSSRRAFLRQAGLGLAAAGGATVLSADARPTAAIRGAEDASYVEIQMGPLQDVTAKSNLARVTPMSYGPWYKPGAPLRGKLCPPGEPGTVFVLSGRVWAFDTKRPLAGAVLDFWHVDLQERYSNGVDDMRNRGRLVSSESGAYELESIRPIPYRPDAKGNPTFWRCAHFHLLAVCPGYAPLVTEIHFQEELHKEDGMYRPENAIAALKHASNGLGFESGVFDIVLEREPQSK